MVNPESKTINKVAVAETTAGWVACLQLDALLHPGHDQPLSKGVYGCGVYITNLRFPKGAIRPGFLGAVSPRSSHIVSVYVASASFCVGLC